MITKKKQEFKEYFLKFISLKLLSFNYFINYLVILIFYIFKVSTSTIILELLLKMKAIIN